MDATATGLDTIQRQILSYAAPGDAANLVVDTDLYRGLSETALHRAARHDGWIGDSIRTDRAIAAAGRLREFRIEKGLSLDDFIILTPLTEVVTTADYRCAEYADIIDTFTMPWIFYVRLV
ncbi:hypothetical protein MUBE_08570, partial [Mycobacterium uberis]